MCKWRINNRPAKISLRQLGSTDYHNRLHLCTPYPCSYIMKVNAIHWFNCPQGGPGSLRSTPYSVIGLRMVRIFMAGGVWSITFEGEWPGLLSSMIPEVALSSDIQFIKASNSCGVHAVNPQTRCSPHGQGSDLQIGRSECLLSAQVLRKYCLGQP